MNNRERRDARNILVKLIVLAMLAVGISLVLAFLPGIDSFNKQWVDAHTRDNGIRGIAGFVAISVMLLSMGAPRQIIALLGGYAFGFAEGVLYSTLAAGISCAATFYLARLYFRPLVNRVLNNKAARINRFLTYQPFMMTMVIRLLPIGNNLLTNLAAGVTRVRLLPFLTGSAVGYLPQMIVFALMGKGLMVSSAWKIALSLVLFVISACLSLYILRRYRIARWDQRTSEYRSPEHCPSFSGK